MEKKQTPDRTDVQGSGRDSGIVDSGGRNQGVSKGIWDRITDEPTQCCTWRFPEITYAHGKDQDRFEPPGGCGAAIALWLLFLLAGLPGFELLQIRTGEVAASLIHKILLRAAGRGQLHLIQWRGDQTGQTGQSRTGCPHTGTQAPN